LRRIDLLGALLGTGLLGPARRPSDNPQCLVAEDRAEGGPEMRIQLIGERIDHRNRRRRWKRRERQGVNKQAGVKGGEIREFDIMRE
jgi:hypothetical protein